MQKALATTVPAGTYYFGDPCYAVPDQFWMDLLNSCDFFSDTLVGTVNGFTVYSAGTMYGDGLYRDSLGREFPVDAGMIGLTPVALAELDTEAFKDGKLEVFGSHLITLTEPTVFLSDGKGNITLGDVVIPTGADNESDFCDDDDYEDEYDSEGESEED